jgi:hypothetical protein
VGDGPTEKGGEERREKRLERREKREERRERRHMCRE